MKIALPTNEDRIDAHFGHCAYFTVFTVNDNNEIIAEEKVASEAGCGCKSNIAGTLARMGVTMMLAGNMGDGAVNVLHSQGIRVVRGCSGDVKAVAEQWLAGNLKDSGMGCHAHEHGCAH
jgi:predicted Fe-Mo cluster-binding NifX family protein